MTLGTQAKVWGIALVVFVALLVLLKSILLPFVAGMAIAYLLDPVCDRLEAMGCSRTMATTIVTAIFAVVVILLLLLIVPLADPADHRIPEQPAGFHRAHAGSPAALLHAAAAALRPAGLSRSWARSRATRIGTALSWLAGLLEGVIGQGLALANLLSLIFITPVVTFYLLRDWDRLVCAGRRSAAARSCGGDPAAGDACQPVAGGLRARAVDGVPDSWRSSTRSRW